MVDVLDDCFPTHARQSSGSVHLRLEVFQFAADAVFIPRAFLGNLLRGSHDAAGNSVVGLFVGLVDKAALDRKSTRLNSSHGYISYAVFCLKKKNLLDRLASISRQATA